MKDFVSPGRSNIILLYMNAKGRALATLCYVGPFSRKKTDPNVGRLHYSLHMIPVPTHESYFPVSYICSLHLHLTLTPAKQRKNEKKPKKQKWNYGSKSKTISFSHKNRRIGDSPLLGEGPETQAQHGLKPFRPKGDCPQLGDFYFAFLLFPHRGVNI